MASGFSLKDQLFNREKTRYLAGLFAKASPGFCAQKFECDVMAGLTERELKARISWIAEVLGTHLPGALPEVAPVLLKALPQPLDPARTDDDFGDFIFAPLGELVVARGLTAYPDLGLDLLAEITQRFSMEWAIRPFLNAHQEKTLTQMRKWLMHPSYHVRRLVSEGSRPRLPWGQGVNLALTDPVPLLDHLHADRTRYVTRSVANHLNDISKKDPELVLDCLKRWRELQVQSDKELAWMTSHACRGLVKAGNPQALLLLGYDPEAEIETCLTLPTEPVRMGEMLNFSVALRALADAGANDQAATLKEAPVLIDYRIIFQKPAGKTSQKVYKLKRANLSCERLVIEKRHRLKGDATTFTLHPGRHQIEVLVNGRVRAQGHFELSV